MAKENPTDVKVLSPWNPSIVVDTATGTGLTFSKPFAIQQVIGDLQRTVTFIAKGTYTVATLTLLMSMDGGNSYVAVGAAMDFFANLAGNLADINGVVSFTPGVLYKFDVTSLTGTSITISLVVT